MAKSLVIVESPTKAKTIGKYLGKQYVVKASLGHVKDLPKKDLAVDVDKGFEPHYEVIEGKKKLIAELKAAAKGMESVYLAADPDREGEAICFHLQEELNGSKKGPVFYRVMFNEITANSVKKAFEKPGSVNLDLVDAQQARRILDRLVGYKISPLLTARFTKKDDQAMEVADEATAKALVDQVENAKYIVRSVSTREKKRNPVPPFITSTLQQESSRKLRFSVKRTMILAQRLYEGVELGAEGSMGLITYMRTDSPRVSQEALDEVRGLIKERFGAQFVPDAPNVYKSKKDAQEAHEAIRPSSAMRTPEQIAQYLQEDELKLYRLIWMRFVASQMLPAVFDQTTIDVAAKGKDGATYMFRATGSVPKFKGFLEVYEEGKDQKDEDDEELKHRLPLVTQGEELKFKGILPEQHFTEPPPRFNEATLVKELEADGVGRPSTYASILSTIQEREYVTKDGGKFTPTELGMAVTDLLLESFQNL